MTASHRQEKPQIVRLDPLFLLVVGKLWLLAKFFFRLFRGIFGLLTIAYLKLCKREVQVRSEVSGEQNQDLKNQDQRLLHARFQKQDSLLRYGGVKWFSLETPEMLIKRNLVEHSDGTATTIEHMHGGQMRKFEFAIFGDIYDEQIENIEAGLRKAFSRFNIESLNLKEIHLITEPGKYLNGEGVPENEIRGFTVNGRGACILHQEISLDPSECARTLERIIEDDLNCRAAASKAGETIWNQSQTVKERISRHPEYSPPDSRNRYGKYRGRHIIDLDSPIVGGIYFGALGREALIVDSEGDALAQAYRLFLQEVRKIKEALGQGFEEQVIRLAAEAGRRVFRHHTPQALTAFRQANRLGTDDETPLDIFVAAETGDSEHSALFVSYLLDRLHNEHQTFLTGRISIDRNWIPGGGHAWTRYTHSERDIYIVDSFRSFCGRLDDYSVARWPYERKTDLDREKRVRPL